MRMKSLAAAAIATSMVAMSPSIAVAQTVAPASKLSIAQSRAGAPAGESRLEGGSGGVIAIALLAGIAAIGVLAIVNGDDNEASPVSS